MALSDGDLIIGDSENQRIRRFDRVAGLVNTIAGIGEQGISPIGTPASEAKFGYFGGIILNRQGEITFTEWINHRIVRIDRKSDTLQLVAGTGTAGSHGDGGPAILASLSGGAALALDHDGNIYFVEAQTKGRLGSVRRIDAQTGIITRIAGIETD
jgi:hypothetical protein